MSKSNDYGINFYDQIEDGSRRSASIVAPLVAELFPDIRSAVDFGCGSGVWLAEFKKQNFYISGLDFGIGAASNLAIPVECYRSVDFSAPIDAGRHDLAISVEVAEHIDAMHADTFVANLTAAAPRVLFSAAIQGQGGHHHVNEQSPQYWIDKFAQRGFRCFDVIRPLIWGNQDVEIWYQQNTLVFMDTGLSSDVERLKSMNSFGGHHLVHPAF